MPAIQYNRMANHKAKNFCPQPLRGETVRSQTDSHELVNVHSLASLRLWIMQAHGSLLGGAQGSWQALTSHAQPRGNKETDSGTTADGRDGNTSGHGRRRGCPRHSCLMGSYVNTSGHGRRRGLRDRRMIFSEPISKKGGFRCLILNKKE